MNEVNGKGEFDTPFGPQRGDVSVTVDGDGKRHYRIKCDPLNLKLNQEITIRCSHPQCLRTAVVADPMPEETKGWMLAPIGTARCPDHPFEWMDR